MEFSENFSKATDRFVANECTCRIIDYSTIFTEPEEHNCFSIIAQVIIRETAFSFILFVSSSKTLRNRAGPSWKISTSVL